MATGDIISVNPKGPYNISDAALYTYLATQNLGSTSLSGQRLEIVPIGNGQVEVIRWSVSGW